MDNEVLKLEDFFKTGTYDIYDELPVGLAICDDEGHVRDCNACYLEILGVTREEILGYNIFDSYNFTDEVMEKIRTSDSYQYDVLYTVPKDVFVNTSADQISISVKIVRLKEDDHTKGYMIYLTNHTNEWKKYEDQLYVQDRRYKDLVDNIPLNYTHTKLIFDDKGQIVDYLNMSGNKSCEDFYIAHNMTWGSTLASKFLPDTGHIIIDKLNELRNSGVTGGHFTYETTEVGEIYEMVVVFEGEEWVNLISIPITNLEMEKREAESRLKEERLEQQKKEMELKEAYLRDEKEHAEVVNSLSTIYSTIFRVDIDSHHYDRLNSLPFMKKSAADSGNFDEVKKIIMDSFMEPEFMEKMNDFLDLNTLTNRLEKINTVTTDYKAPNGQWIQARFIVKKRDEDGVVKEILYVERDSTEEKIKDFRQQEVLREALAVAQQANKAKTTFLNSMSHDIRTPMNAIIGFTSLAQKHIGEQEKVEDYLTKIGTSSTHLLSLINDILDMSRIESGTVKLDEKPVNIPKILNDIRTMILESVNSKRLNFFIDTQDIIHKNVLTDKLRLNQILLNIVSNAVKFTQPGGNILIRLAEKPCGTENYATYEFSVKDDGIGMSQEFLGHIFETFTREYSATVSGIQGTGLGMAITKNIVDMMGGDIRVESEEGKGSLFTVTLNLQFAGEAERNETTSESQDMLTQPIINEITAKEGKKKIYDYSGKHILLVEDNELNREIATAILGETGMTIDSVNDGDVAVSTINGAPADKYDLILMDIQMPKMDGYTATRKIRTLPDNKKANIPIVAMTANAFEEDKQKAYASGMNGHIIKPISIEEIARELDRIFAKKDKK